MKDIFGLFGLAMFSGGLFMLSIPWAFVGAGAVIIIWATIEDIKNDR